MRYRDQQVLRLVYNWRIRQRLPRLTKYAYAKGLLTVDPQEGQTWKNKATGEAVCIDSVVNGQASVIQVVGPNKTIDINQFRSTDWVCLGY